MPYTPVPWESVDTVLLDMDGTLLDLNFDNQFWLSHVPQRYAEKNNLTLQDATESVMQQCKQVEGQLDWYCVDYWTQELGLDIERLKHEIAHLIAVHPGVIGFLEWLRDQGKFIALVTNAHQKSLAIKMQKTRLADHFDAIICSHDTGLPKEDPRFWHKLHEYIDYQPQRSLFIDDSSAVLASAQRYGIGHLLMVCKPDSTQQARDPQHYNAIHNFTELLPADR